MKRKIPFILHSFNSNFLDFVTVNPKFTDIGSKITASYLLSMLTIRKHVSIKHSNVNDDRNTSSIFYSEEFTF